MRGAWIVAVREIVERRTLLLAALVAGAIPFVAPLLPGVRAGQGADARDVGALVVATSFALGSALLLGAAAVGRDLVEGRLSFDFVRPLGTGAIWGGRLVAALVLALLVLAITLVPTTLAGGGALSIRYGDAVRQGSLIMLPVILLLVPLAHTVGIAARSRSGWLAADMAGLIVVIVVVGVSARALMNAFAIELLAYASVALGLLTIPVFWGASAAQVAIGRTDIKRGHRVQSVVLWSALGGLAALFAGWTAWVLAAGPRDIVDAWASPAPAGSWVRVTGSATGRGDFTPTVLLDTESGRHVRLGGTLRWTAWGDVLFSADGRRAVWLRYSGPRDLVLDAYTIDLDQPEPVPRETSLTFSSPWGEFALSPDGSRIAAMGDGLLAVHDVASGANLASVRVPGTSSAPRTALVVFVTPDRLRVVERKPNLRVLELDVPSRRVEITGEASTPFEWPAVVRDAARDRMLVFDLRGGSSALLLDGRDASVVREIRVESARSVRFSMLADGRIVTVAPMDGATEIRVFSPEGIEARRFEIPSSGRTFVGAETGSARFTIACTDEGAPGRWRGTTVLVDADAGTAREVARDLVPFTAFWWTNLGGAHAPGSLASRLFYRNGTLVLFDPTTGRQRDLTGPSAGSPDS